MYVVSSRSIGVTLLRVIGSGLLLVNATAVVLIFGLFIFRNSLTFAIFLRSQRLNFDVSSPNGILLFREASKMICTYGKYLFPHWSLQYAITCFWKERGSLFHSFEPPYLYEFVSWVIVQEAGPLPE